MSTSMREALEQVRSLSEHGVNNPDEALSQVSSLCDAVLSPEPDRLSEEEGARIIADAMFGIDDEKDWVDLGETPQKKLKRAAAAIIDRLSRQPEAEPVAWIEFADNGNIRFWTSDPARAWTEGDNGRPLRKFTLTELVALAASPRLEPQTAPDDRRSQANELAEWIIGYLVNECALDEGCVAPPDRDNVANAVLNNITGFVPNDLLDAADELLNKPGIARIRIKSQGHNLLDREEVFRRLVHARKAAIKADANAPAEAERLALAEVKTDQLETVDSILATLDRYTDSIQGKNDLKCGILTANYAMLEAAKIIRLLVALRAGGWREDMQS